MKSLSSISAIILASSVAAIPHHLPPRDNHEYNSATYQPHHNTGHWVPDAPELSGHWVPDVPAQSGHWVSDVPVPKAQSPPVATQAPQPPILVLGAQPADGGRLFDFGAIGDNTTLREIDRKVTINGQVVQDRIFTKLVLIDGSDGACSAINSAGDVVKGAGGQEFIDESRKEIVFPGPSEVFGARCWDVRQNAPPHAAPAPSPASAPPSGHGGHWVEDPVPQPQPPAHGGHWVEDPAAQPPNHGELPSNNLAANEVLLELITAHGDKLSEPIKTTNEPDIFNLDFTSFKILDQNNQPTVICAAFDASGNFINAQSGAAVIVPGADFKFDGSVNVHAVACSLGTPPSLPNNGQNGNGDQQSSTPGLAKDEVQIELANSVNGAKHLQPVSINGNAFILNDEFDILSIISENHHWTVVCGAFDASNKIITGPAGAAAVPGAHLDFGHPVRVHAVTCALGGSPPAPSVNGELNRPWVALKLHAGTPSKPTDNILVGPVFIDNHVMNTKGTPFETEKLIMEASFENLNGHENVRCDFFEEEEGVVLVGGTGGQGVREGGVGAVGQAGKHVRSIKCFQV